MGNLRNVWGGERHKGRVNTLEGSAWKRGKKKKLVCGEAVYRCCALVP